MPNTTNELKERLIRLAERSVEIVLAERDYFVGRGLGDQGQYFGASAGEATYETFATGYDTGTGLTTFAFRLDFSLLDGPDLLA